MKICKKGLHQYEPINGNKPGCPECRNARRKLYYKADPEKVKAVSRSWAKANPEKVKSYVLKRKYGIDLDQYNQILAKQDGKCAICGTNQSKLQTPLHVDHCHATGKVRGLLCNFCNQGIGLLKESEENLTNAITYLRKTK